MNTDTSQSVASGGRLQLLAILPSESAIHFVVYAVSVFLAVGYIVIGPAVALLFGESRYLAGTSFVVMELLVFGVSAWGEYRFWTASPTEELRQSKTPNVWRFVGRSWGWVTRRRNQRIAPFPTTGAGKGFYDFFRSTWLRVMPGYPLPELVWSCYDSRVAARVTGSPRNPSLLVSAGLVSLWPKHCDVVEIYLLHEFGHLVNRDLGILGLSAALSRATNLTILTSLLLAGAVVLPFLTGDVQGALILLVSTLWAVVTVVLGSFLLRYGGWIISLRELYADVWALLQTRANDAFETVVSMASGSIARDAWQRMRSIVSLRLIHLSAAERREILTNPDSLVFPRIRYFALTAILVVVIQNSPFAEGYGRNWERLPLLLCWAPLCSAFVMNVVRSLFAVGQEPGLWVPKRQIGLTVALSVGLILPSLRIQGLYGILASGVGGQGSFIPELLDTLRTLRVTWIKPVYLCVPVAAYGWLTLTATLLRRPQYPGRSSSEHSMAYIRHSNHRMLRWAVGAVAAATLLLAGLMYESENPTILDPFQSRLHSFEVLPQIVGLGILSLGSYVTFTRRPRLRE